jgi:hypothetical protein
MAIIDRERDTIGFEQLSKSFTQTQQVLMRVQQNSQPIREVPAVCYHPQQIIDLQWQITDLQTKKFLPQQCDLAVFEQQIYTLMNERDAGRSRPAAPGMDEGLRQELADMIQDSQQCGEEARSSRRHLANSLTLAARAARAVPQALEDRGQRFPDSPNVSGSDGTLLRGWIAQIRMVTQYKPASCLDQQSKMRYVFNRQRRITLGQILSQVREDNTIGLEDLSPCIQLLQPAFGDLDRVAAAEQKMREIIQRNRKFFQYYAEFQIIATNLDGNPWALRNALRMVLSEEMKDSFTYGDMPEDVPVFVTVCQKRDIQIRQ